MNQLDIDWNAAPEWAQWAAQDGDGGVFYYAEQPYTANVRERWLSDSGVCVAALAGVLYVGHSKDWRDSLTQRPQTVTSHQDSGGAGMLRVQIGHLLEYMTPEQLDALYAHIRKQLDAAKFDELNRQLDQPFGEVPREWQLKAFEAFLDGHTVSQQYAAGSWHVAPAPQWLRDTKYRIYPKQS